MQSFVIVNKLHRVDEMGNGLAHMIILNLNVLPRYFNWGIFK